MRSICITALALMLASAAALAAPNASGEISVDDWFGLYTGQADGSDLALVGRSAGTWQNEQTFAFEVTPGDYLYVVAYNDAGFGPPHMLIAGFSTPSGALVTNSDDWRYYISANPAPTSTTLPSMSQIQGDIAAANAAGWSAPLAEAPNGTSTWGAAISDSSANFIWPDSFHRGGEPASAADGHYVLFRSAQTVAAIPEPSRALLFVAGLALFAIRRVRSYDGGVAKREEIRAARRS